MATESAALPGAQGSSATVQHIGESTCRHFWLNSDQEACLRNAENICKQCYLIKVRLFRIVISTGVWQASSFLY